MNLVCVDRERLTLGILAARFDHLGWQARFSLSALKGLELIEAGPPDVLVTEIQLQASNGYSLIQAVRGHRHPAISSLPILILSHMSQPDDILRGIRLGANGYITKPFDLTRFEEDVTFLADGRQP